MSDTLVDASFDEEKYGNDSFETEVPESSSFYSSEIDEDESNEQKQLQQQQRTQQPPAAALSKTKPFTRTAEFMTCESSSDEDDVIMGETIAEINAERIDFYDESDDNADDDEADGSSLTPAQRVFQMASASRRQAQATNHGFPTPPDSKESVTNEDIIDDFDDDFELSDCEEFVALERATCAAEEHYRNYAELASGEEFVDYEEEEEIVFGRKMRMESFCEDGGEVDIGEPNIGEELGEEEQELDEELVDDVLSDEEFDAANSENGSISSHTEEEKSDDDTKAAAGGASPVGADDAAVAGALSERRVEGAEENHSLHADDSMESFKRRVMLSQRMRCQSEGAGDCANIRGTGRNIRSSIPVWTGSVNRASYSSRVANGAAMLSVSQSKISVRSHASAPDYNEKSETECNEKFLDSAAGGDYTECSDGFTDVASTFDGNTSAYEKELERFLIAGKTPKPPKKLKAGERRNKSFSNERLRDIERSNHILLRKIINQKPTVVTNEKKKKNSKFASLPPTTRLTSAEINRKRQERQIALDNQLFKKKLDAILQRKPKNKPKT